MHLNEIMGKEPWHLLAAREIGNEARKLSTSGHETISRDFPNFRVSFSSEGENSARIFFLQMGTPRQVLSVRLDGSLNSWLHGKAQMKKLSDLETFSPQTAKFSAFNDLVKVTRAAHEALKKHAPQKG